MCEHEKKYCPRCKDEFECKVGSILLCQCAAVPLNQDERDFISSKYTDCLCAGCLKEMKAVYHAQLFNDKLTGISSLRFSKAK